MKKLIFSAAIGLALVALTPALSQAGTFGLITGGWCCGCCNKCNFCVRPYNAFTPVCSGNITCMGCMPFAYPTPNYTGLGYVQPNLPSAPYSNCVTGEVIVGQPQVRIVQPAQPAQQVAQPALPAPFSPPPPAPAIQTPPTPTSMMPNPYGVMQAGYYQMYNPYAIYGSTGSVPYYWNAK
jgi:hypothetical protein